MYPIRISAFELTLLQHRSCTLPNMSALDWIPSHCACFLSPVFAVFPSVVRLLGDHIRFLQCIKRSMSEVISLLSSILMHKTITAAPYR